MTTYTLAAAELVKGSAEGYQVIGNLGLGQCLETGN